jgi:hypothetical protein
VPHIPPTVPPAASAARTPMLPLWSTAFAPLIDTSRARNWPSACGAGVSDISPSLNTHGPSRSSSITLASRLLVTIPAVLLPLSPAWPVNSSRMYAGVTPLETTNQPSWRTHFTSGICRTARASNRFDSRGSNITSAWNRSSRRCEADFTKLEVP